MNNPTTIRHDARSRARMDALKVKLETDNETWVLKQGLRALVKEAGIEQEVAKAFVGAGSEERK